MIPGPRIPAGSDARVDREDLSEVFRRFYGRKVSYCTHGIHRYPAKFIPQVPTFCIEKYSREGDSILDPFMGSGTTLLEAILHGRDALGIDIHPLAKLITKVKVTPLETDSLQKSADALYEEIEQDHDDNFEWIPEMYNFEHWFREDVARDLATIKKHVWALPEGGQKDFFKICFSSIIRKVSNSDDDSLIPEVTAFRKKLVEQGKADFDAISRFEHQTNLRIVDFEDLNRELGKIKRASGREPRVRLIGKDAREIELGDDEVNFSVSSPPYASAVHYVSVHKLEMAWLGMLEENPGLDANIVGTIRAYSEEYNNWTPGGMHPEVDGLVESVFKEDKKTAYVLQKYFGDMQRNLREMHRVLADGGAYCLVAGENVLKKTRVPTYRMLNLLAEAEGFRTEKIFDYDIINRHLDVPRWNNSTILQDHIIVLRK